MLKKDRELHGRSAEVPLEQDGIDALPDDGAEEWQQRVNEVVTGVSD